MDLKEAVCQSGLNGFDLDLRGSIVAPKACRQAGWTKDDLDCSRLRHGTSKQSVSLRPFDLGGQMSVIDHVDFCRHFFKDLLPSIRLDEEENDFANAEVILRRP